MGYREAFVLRWSRRDRLAVLVVAVTIAFLTGVTLLGLAMGSQTTAIAAGLGSQATVEHHSSVDSARAAAASDAFVLPVTSITVDGTQRTVVGVPSSVPPITLAERERTFEFPQGEPGVLAAVDHPVTVDRTVETRGGTREVTLSSRPDADVIPDRWYVTSVGTVDRLDPTGAFVLTTGEGSSGPLSGNTVPLLSALTFFVLGTRQLIDLLYLMGLAGGVLVAVTAFSVTRVAVEDRRETIAVVRSTGATPRRVYALFGVRALLLSAVGVALGYAIGFVLVRSVVNAAVFVGAPTSLTVAVSPRAVELLAPMSVLLVVIGGTAGVVAARPAIRPPPAAVSRPESPSGDTTGGLVSGTLPESVRRSARPTVLGWDALVPSTATLSVFVMFVLLIAAAGGVLAPLTAADEQTITEADAVHPIASSVPVSYAETLQQQGIDASPEQLLFETIGNDPFVVRGVDYPAYAALSDPTIVRGRAPMTETEAVIGADLRQTLGVEVGDTITLGGSTVPAFTRVRIVGVFTGDGLQDDQLLVSLETASSLSGRPEGVVNFVRTEALTEHDGGGPTISVLDATVQANDSATNVRLTVQNYGLSAVDDTLTVQLGEETRTVDVDLRSGGQQRVTLAFSPRPDGEYQLRAGAFAESVRVGTAADAGLSVTLPTRIPVGTDPAVVVTRNDQPVSNATVTVSDRNRTWTTNADGVVRVPFPSPGNHTVAVSSDGAQTRTSVAVGSQVQRRFVSTVTVSPERPSIATRPVAVATLNNPWSQPVTRTVTIVSTDRVTERELTLQPGGTDRLRGRLPYRPAGTYTVSVLQEGRNTSATTYDVQGDERLAAALASSGRQSSGGGIAQAIEIVFGNIRVLVAAMVVLVSVMTVGATTASFSRSIHAARDEIGVRRAVGASPVTIYRLVLGDTLRIGGLSALLAVTFAGTLVWGLLSIGELRLYGVALRPSFSPALLAAVAICALALALVSVAVATVSLVTTSPAALLTAVRREPPGPRSGERPTSEVSADD
jgi:ABC-type antimicrobial peptide transport system permease subunit